MANVLAVNDIWRLSVFCANTNQVAVNTTHWRVSAVGGTPATDLDAVQTLDTTVAPFYKVMMGNTATYYGCKFFRINPRIGSPLPATTSASTGIGTGGVGVLPGQVSGIISLESNLAGRAGRGRLYIPFPFTGANDAVLNKPTAAYLGFLVSLAGAYETTTFVVVGGRTATLIPVLYHRGSATSTPDSTYIGRQTWGTQKRRGNYGRPNVFPPF